MSFPLRISIISKIAPILDEGWKVHEDDKLRRMPVVPAQETVWRFANVKFSCIKWHRIFFELLSDKTKVHSHCHNCFKVVVEPRNLSELQIIESYQQLTSVEDIQSKCGIEIREFVPRLYGAYWYNRSVEEARERKTEVLKFLTDIFGENHPEIYIKKGCSEFERALGPSDKWEITDPQRKLEEKLDDAMDFDPFTHQDQPPLIIERTHETWINWTWAIGDKEEVLKVTGGVPLIPDFIRYDEEEEKSDEEKE